MKNKKVIVYSTPTCPYCVYTKRYFNDNNIAFEDVDVSADRSKAQEMIEKSGQMGVPVIDIDGQILVGFQPEAFARLLK
ncbi:MAG: glutaredoxin domain-containing protein [Candidatus Paceibacterota bacterium]|jgi:glutaredoxin-like YruB-family protein|nr:glutathione S-transferase N-terminal domain-containing protein [Candidatus Paceibacterota bacterium]